MDISKTMLNKMQVFWNRVSRWIMNGFYATNICVLSSEACLAPMKVYAKQMKLMSTIRITTAVPENNVAMAMLPQSFLVKSDFRLETNRRAAFNMNRGGMRPKVWTSKCNTTFQVRLPVDEIAARASVIFIDGQVPTRPTRLVRVTPKHAERHFMAKEAVRKLMHQKWVDEPYPHYYEYRPPYREC